MNSGILTVSDTLDVRPFPVDVQNALGSENAPSSSVRDDAIRARLADVARQEEKRRRLLAFLERETPAWNPDDHPDIDAAGTPEDENLDQLLASSRDAKPEVPEQILAAPAREVAAEFVELVKGNPKVWAVCATQENSVLHLWTYVDSTDDRDRSPIYRAEWQMLSRYPDVQFDFNVMLLPAGGEQFEDNAIVYLYKR